jgi:hypothetical protein
LSDKYRNLAWEFAQELDERITFKHVSLIFQKKNLVSIGTNVRKTHPQAKAAGYMFDQRHSELDALIRVPRENRDNLILINYRFNKRGELRLSKPCTRCEPWVRQVFKEILFSTSEGVFSTL